MHRREVAAVIVEKEEDGLAGGRIDRETVVAKLTAAVLAAGIRGEEAPDLVRPGPAFGVEVDVAVFRQRGTYRLASTISTASVQCIASDFTVVPK